MNFSGIDEYQTPPRKLLIIVILSKDSFYEFSSEESSSVDSSLSYSFAYSNVKYEMSSSTSTTSATKSYYTVASMRIERYYSSIKDEVSELIPEAMQLLEQQNYVGFFKSCGPSYVRGIRRAQEVTATFSLKSTSSETVKSYNNALKVGSYGRSKTKNSSFSAVNKDLKISVKGWGLGLTVEGSETLVAENKDEFDAIMRFAWKTMTQVPDAVHIGQVYGFEVVPWVENVMFQVAAKVDDEIVEVPLKRSLIPRAFLRSDPNDFTFDNDNRDLSKCKKAGLAIDMYGYCCEEGQLYDSESKEYGTGIPEETMCKPIRQLDPAIVKEHLVQNGEFAAKLDRVLRYKINRLMTLEKCTSAINAVPTRKNFHILKSREENMDGNSTMAMNITVYEMRMAMDPFQDLGLLKSTAKELDEFIDMFYQPCMAALYGATVGSSPNTDVSYFLAYPWYYHTECSALSCFGDGMRWDRTNGGCVPGALFGSGATPYSGDDSNCKKVTNLVSGDLVCENTNDSLAAETGLFTACMDKVSSVSSISFFLDNYCLPELTGDTISSEAEFLLRQAAEAHCTTYEEKSINVALKKPTRSSSVGWGGYPHRAVDGNHDGTWWRYTTTHTRYNSAPWLYVDLEEDFDIKRVVVWNRRDCCDWRLSDFKMTIYNDGNVVCEYQHSGRPSRYDTEIIIADIADCNTENTVVGDRVQISIPGSGYLQIAELEVFNSFLVEVDE